MKAIEFIENEIGNAHDNPNLDNEMLAELFDKYAEARAGQHETIVMRSRLSPGDKLICCAKGAAYGDTFTVMYEEGMTLQCDKNGTFYQLKDVDLSEFKYA